MAWKLAESSEDIVKEFEPEDIPVPSKIRSGDGGAADSGNFWILEGFNNGFVPIRIANDIVVDKTKDVSFSSLRPFISELCKFALLFYLDYLEVLVSL